MKKLDWKSFAIGVLLTTTVIACVGATSVNDKWDADQQWEVIQTIGLRDGAGKRLGELGFYPFETEFGETWENTNVMWRKRIK